MAARISCILIAIVALIATLVPWYSLHLQESSLHEAESGYQVEALHDAESAVKYNPYSVSALFVLAGAEQRVGRAAQARQALAKAAELQPQNYQTWEQLAIYERDKWGEPDLAHDHFEQAISLNPQDNYLKEIAGATSSAAGS